MLFRLGLKRGEETNYFEKVEELSVYVAYNNDRLLNEEDIGLVFWMEGEILAVWMNLSVRSLSQVLGRGTLSERSCLSLVMLILLSFPSC